MAGESVSEGPECKLTRVFLAMGAAVVSIKDWPEQDRPREKLLTRGAAALSDSELLAVVLRTGVAGRSAVELSRGLLEDHGGLSGLLAMPQDALTGLPGLGIAKAAQIQAVLEIARRVLAEELKTRDVLTSPDRVKDFLRLSLQHLDREVFVVIYLDAQNRVLCMEELFRGTLTQTSVYPREVVKGALARNAAAVIFAHNHPSGVAEPSHADEALTRALKSALALVDIAVLDHFVVGQGCAVSFAERGLL
jgi:DNA repair protein RadC